MRSSPVNYDAMAMKDLKQRCALLNIDLPKKSTRKEIIGALREYDAANAAPETPVKQPCTPIQSKYSNMSTGKTTSGERGSTRRGPFTKPLTPNSREQSPAKLMDALRESPVPSMRYSPSPLLIRQNSSIQPKFSLSKFILFVIIITLLSFLIYMTML